MQISCCSTASAFTLDGRSGGYFFRTIPVARSMALVHAMTAVDKGYKKTVIMYINNDFGNGVAPDAKRAIEKLGGGVAGVVPYAENQPSYRSDVTKALALSPDFRGDRVAAFGRLFACETAKVSDDLRAQRLESRTVVHRFTVARARQVHGEYLADPR